MHKVAELLETELDDLLLEDVNSNKKTIKGIQ